MIINLLKDNSVLENFHVAQAFKTMLQNEENNILSELTLQEFRIVRRRIIECIVATDMVNHNKHLNILKSKIEILNIENGNNVNKLIVPEDENKTFDNQQLILNSLVHLSDLSNPYKPKKISLQWTDLVFKEFFNQGDLEKKSSLPVSLLCDRETTNVSKSQIGFINFVVKPLFNCVMSLAPEIKPYQENLDSNLKYHEEQVASANSNIDKKN